MIKISELTKESDINRKVIYQPQHSNGKIEEGRITSWNDTYIFVDYSNSGRGIATRPEDLSFISK